MKNKRKAVYAASLDPITNGHINVIERMAPLYDELVVLVSVDGRKTYTFTLDEKVRMAKNAVAHLPNVSVDTCVGRYVVKQAADIGAQAVVRGLRNFKDLEDEQTLAQENRKICPEIETIWVPCLPDLMHVSSSMVKSHVGVDPDWETQVARSVPVSVVSELKKKFVAGKARKYWAKLVALLGNPAGSEAVLEDLVARYNEPHRFYHTLTHIVTMLDELELVGEYTPALALAIWFHDDFYDTKAKDNEDRSAKHAEDSIRQMGLPDSLGTQVSDLILVTKHTGVPKNRAAKILVDIDLMILGSSEREFDAYESCVRNEYSWVPETDFRAARIKILQSFLDRNSIFSTKQFRGKYESAARKNLQRSIEKLQ